MFDMTQKDIVRFWSKVDKRGPDECWPWTAKSRYAYGYGAFKLKNGKPGGANHPASKVSCFLENGPAPDSKPFALHSCDNPTCCNPKHLRWGSQQDNVDDAHNRGRASKPPANYKGRHTGKMPRGEDLHNHSITEDIARETWRLHLQGGLTVKSIAAIVGAKPHVVADLVRGRGWRHLDGAPSIEELKTGGVRRGHNQFSA